MPQRQQRMVTRTARAAQLPSVYYLSKALWCVHLLREACVAPTMQRRHSVMRSRHCRSEYHTAASMIRRRIVPTSATGSDTSAAGSTSHGVRRLQQWKWSRPLFIIAVSAATMLDQSIYLWLILDYAWKGAQLVCMQPTSARHRRPIDPEVSHGRVRSGECMHRARCWRRL